MVSKTHKHHVQGKIAPQYDVVVNANSNGDVCTINNPLPVVNVGSSNNIDLAAGNLEGYFHINKFGATDGDVTSGTIWDGNSSTTTYPYPAASVVAVASTANSGANVYVEGLDATYNLQNETVAIGSSSVSTFSRIFRAYMVDTNNDADVTLSLGGTLVAKILEDTNQTLMAVYTVPAGKTGYLLNITMGSDKASVNSAMIYSVLTREITDGGIFRIKGRFYAAGGQTVDHVYQVPLKFSEKTDIRIDCIAAQQSGVSSTFDIVLVDN